MHRVWLVRARGVQSRIGRETRVATRADRAHGQKDARRRRRTDERTGIESTTKGIHSTMIEAIEGRGDCSHLTRHHGGVRTLRGRVGETDIWSTGSQVETCTTEKSEWQLRSTASGGSGSGKLAVETTETGNGIGAVGSRTHQDDGVKETIGGQTMTCWRGEMNQTTDTLTTEATIEQTGGTRATQATEGWRETGPETDTMGDVREETAVEQTASERADQGRGTMRRMSDTTNLRSARLDDQLPQASHRTPPIHRQLTHRRGEWKTRTEQTACTTLASRVVAKTGRERKAETTETRETGAPTLTTQWTEVGRWHRDSHRRPWHNHCRLHQRPHRRNRRGLPRQTRRRTGVQNDGNHKQTTAGPLHPTVNRPAAPLPLALWPSQPRPRPPRPRRCGRLSQPCRHLSVHAAMPTEERTVVVSRGANRSN